MVHSFEQLKAIEPPPDDPVEPGSDDEWHQIEQRLGVTFPSHYKEYTRLYGAGQWAEFFGIINPFYQWKHPKAHGYFRWMETRLEGLDELRKEHHDLVVPFNRHPAPGGLLPFGYDDNGGTLCFLTTGEVDAWPIVLLSSKFSGSYDTFRGPISAMLIALLQQAFQPNSWPRDVFPIQRPAFKRYTMQ